MAGTIFYELGIEVETINEDITFTKSVDAILDALIGWNETALQNSIRVKSELFLFSDSLLYCFIPGAEKGVYMNKVVLSVEASEGMPLIDLRRMFKVFIYNNDESKILRHIKIDEYSFKPVLA